MSRSPRLLLAPVLLVSGLFACPAFGGDRDDANRSNEPMCANPRRAGNSKAPPPEFVACSSLPAEVPPTGEVAAVDLAANVAAAAATE